jgi:Reverse transcriptase (RNA-dependent DNA polymerase)
MNMAAAYGWVTRQLDFVLTFPQAPVETDLYMEIPRGFLINGDKSQYVLKLVNNLYDGQKQAGRVWYKYLSNGLCEKLGFQQSKHDPCIFWRDSTIIVVYTDDTIVTGPVQEEVDKAIADIAGEFTITNEPNVSDFLGVKINRDNEKKQYTLTQPHLIQSILDDLGLKDNSKSRDVPALSSKILQCHEDKPPHDGAWHYRSVIGKLNYLEKCSRPDIAYAVHQCARFAHNPRTEHTKAVKLIGRYLKTTADKGIICTPNGDSFTCYADADFAGLWDATTAEKDSSTACSRSGYVILHNNCPIVWASWLQTEIAMSSTESEYISLSQSLREVLPLMELARELSDAGFNLGVSTPKIHCKAFEDNSGALEMARTPKLRPRTKHLNIKYHHFREAVEDGSVSIHSISTENQLADIFTKPLPVIPFAKLRLKIMGW